MKFCGLFQLGVGYEDPTGEFCLAFWCEPCVCGGWGGGGEPVIPQKSFARFCGKVRIISPYNSDIFKMPHVFFRGPSIYLTFVRKDIWFKMLRLRMGNFH